MLTVSLLGWISGLTPFYGVMDSPPSITPVFLQLDLEAALDLSMVSIIFSLLLVDLFDATGTIVGIADRSGLINKEGKIYRLKWALLSDSTATTCGALLGTSPTTGYIESAAGVESGGKTGLSAVTAGLLFIVCLAFSPLVKSIPSFATSAALLFVSFLMIKSIRLVDWSDITEFFPAIMLAIGMPFMFSISDGIGIGFISYVSIKLLSGNREDCSLASYCIAGIFIIKFLVLD